MFNKILYKYSSEAGYAEYTRRRLPHILAVEIPLIPLAPRSLWSASHNVKGGDTCPFAIPFIFPFSYRTNGTRSERNLFSPSPFFYFAHSLSHRSPSQPHPHPAMRSVRFEPLFTLRLEIWVLNKSILSLCTRPHPAVQADLACPGPPREAPMGGGGGPSAWVQKNLEVGG